MKTIILLAIAMCAYGVCAKETNESPVHASDKDKRQTQDEIAPTRLVYRMARKQEQIAPVEEPQEDENPALSRGDLEEYRPGQVFSVNAQELLDLQPERKAPYVGNNQQLQQLYSEPQPEQKQNLQQYYYLESQLARQVQPSHAVITRPHFSSNGGEASVGAALSVSETGASGATDSLDQDLLALLAHTPVRGEDPRQQAYLQTPQVQQVSSHSVAPQYQQVDKYPTKPSKKPTKLRSKSQMLAPQNPTAPQQYLIETTNVQQQQQPQQHYRPASQQQRTAQSLRYVEAPQTQRVFYEQPEPEGLKVVAPPNLQQQLRSQPNFRLVPQFQPEDAPKQYRIIDPLRVQLRQEQSRQASSVDRPVTYLKRYPDPEKMRSIKSYEQNIPEGALIAQQPQQPQQIIGEQYFLRPVYRSNEHRGRYQLSPPTGSHVDQVRAPEPTKPPHSAIYVSKNIAPKKIKPQPYLREQPQRVEQPLYQQQQPSRFELEQQSRIEQVNIEQHGQNIEDQRSHLPPPRNNKAYTPEEFAALVAAGYAVTPIPVNAQGTPMAQSRSGIDAPIHPPRRQFYTRRHQYLPLRSDEAP